MCTSFGDFALVSIIAKRKYSEVLVMKVLGNLNAEKGEISKDCNMRRMLKIYETGRNYS